jgi:hypothetical protein
MWRRLTSPDDNIAIELYAQRLSTVSEQKSEHWIAFGIAAAVGLGRLYGARLIDALLAFS